MQSLYPPTIKSKTVQRMTLQHCGSGEFQEDDANQDKRYRRQGAQTQVGHDAMLQLHLVSPLAVDSRQLLLGLDAVVVEAEELALFPSKLQTGKLCRVGPGGIGSSSIRAGIGLRFESVVLRSQIGCVHVRLLHGL